jgi:hypothetical protein
LDSSPNIIKTIKSRRRRLVGYVEREKRSLPIINRMIKLMRINWREQKGGVGFDKKI